MPIRDDYFECLHHKKEAREAARRQAQSRLDMYAHVAPPPLRRSSRALLRLQHTQAVQRQAITSPAPWTRAAGLVVVGPVMSLALGVWT